MHGPLSFAIPSAVRGYALAVERFGRLPWRDLVAPAVALAKARAAGRLVRDGQGRQSAAADLRRYDESRRVWLPDGLPPVTPPNGDAAACSHRPARRHAGAARRSGTGGFLSAARSPRRSSPTSQAGGGVLSAEDLAQCRARIVPSLEIPYRGYTFQAARGLTAAPTLADVLDRLASKSFGKRPDADYFEALVEALAAGLCRPARRAWRYRAAGGKLHHAHHRGRPRRRHRRADDDAAVELRQPLRAARHRHPDE